MYYTYLSATTTTTSTFFLFFHFLLVHFQCLSCLCSFFILVHLILRFFFFFAVCNQFSRGVFAILGAISPESFVTLHSYSNTFQMPFLSSWYPEKVKCCFYKNCYFFSFSLLLLYIYKSVFLR